MTEWVEVIIFILLCHNLPVTIIYIYIYILMLDHCSPNRYACRVSILFMIVWRLMNHPTSSYFWDHTVPFRLATSTTYRKTMKTTACWWVFKGQRHTWTWSILNSSKLTVNCLSLIPCFHWKTPPGHFQYPWKCSMQIRKCSILAWQFPTNGLMKSMSGPPKTRAESVRWLPRGKLTWCTPRSVVSL